MNETSPQSVEIGQMGFVKTESGTMERRSKRIKASRVPTFEALERREVFSVTPIFARAALRAQALHTRQLDVFMQAQLGLYPPGTPQPTPPELNRQKYVAKLVGSYATGLPRFTDQASQIGVLASGGSNQSLHVSLQMTLFPPADPNAPVVGDAAIFPKNIAETGSLLALNLTAPPTGILGTVPNQWTWTADSNSGGVYLAAGSNGVGQGTMTIRLIRTGGTRAFPSGKAVIIFKGLIRTGGIYSDIATPGNRPNHP